MLCGCAQSSEIELLLTIKQNQVRIGQDINNRNGREEIATCRQN